jgi:NAD-dependent dihydropyrimidine dehydrogenase PreA subunit
MIRRTTALPGVEWVDGAGDFVQIVSEKCSGCGNCMNVCLGGCFDMKDGSARVQSLDMCMECGACWYVCEEEAILFSWPKGGTGFKTDWG